MSEEKRPLLGCMILLALAAVGWFLVLLMLLGAISLFTSDRADAAEGNDPKISRVTAYNAARYVAKHNLASSLAGTDKRVKVAGCNLNASGTRWVCPTEVSSTKTECTLSIEVWPKSKTALYYVFRHLHCADR